MASSTCLFRLRTILNIYECSRAKLYLDIAKGTFPPPLKKGISSFWIESEVIACNEAIIAGLTEYEMKEFVQELLKSRITKDELKNKYSHHQQKKDAKQGEQLKEVAHG